MGKFLIFIFVFMPILYFFFPTIFWIILFLFFLLIAYVNYDIYKTNKEKEEIKQQKEEIRQEKIEEIRKFFIEKKNQLSKYNSITIQEECEVLNQIYMKEKQLKADIVQKARQEMLKHLNFCSISQSKKSKKIIKKNYENYIPFKKLELKICDLFRREYKTYLHRLKRRNNIRFMKKFDSQKVKKELVNRFIKESRFFSVDIDKLLSYEFSYDDIVNIDRLPFDNFHPTIQKLFLQGDIKICMYYHLKPLFCISEKGLKKLEQCNEY